jgi:hypothetical protein
MDSFLRISPLERSERSASREGSDNPAPFVESELFFWSASGKEVQMQFVDPSKDEQVAIRNFVRLSRPSRGIVIPPLIGLKGEQVFHPP